MSGATQQETPTPDALAHHEAGHVVVAVALGRGIKHATIDPTAAHWGHVRHETGVFGGLESLATQAETGDARLRWLAREAAVNHAMIAGAGPIAEGIYCGAALPDWRAGHVHLLRPIPRPHPDAYGDDLADFLAALYIAANGSIASMGYQTRAIRALRRYLKHALPVVRDVAAMLLHERTVGGEEIEDAAHESAERHGVDLYQHDVIASWWKPPRGMMRGAVAAEAST